MTSLVERERFHLQTLFSRHSVRLRHSAEPPVLLMVTPRSCSSALCRTGRLRRPYLPQKKVDSSENGNLRSKNSRKEIDQWIVFRSLGTACDRLSRVPSLSHEPHLVSVNRASPAALAEMMPACHQRNNQRRGPVVFERKGKYRTFMYIHKDKYRT